jgi:hypothetical protein
VLAAGFAAGDAAAPGEAAAEGDPAAAGDAAGLAASAGFAGAAVGLAAIGGLQATRTMADAANNAAERLNNGVIVPPSFISRNAGVI